MRFGENMVFFMFKLVGIIILPLILILLMFILQEIMICRALSGGFNWNGLIVVTGECRASGGGGPNTINIKGALLANPFLAANGHVKIRYYSCEIVNALYTRPATPISWKEMN